MLRSIALVTVLAALSSCNDGPASTPDGGGKDAGLGGDGGSLGASGNLVFPDLDPSSTASGRQPRVAVDAQGRVHVLYTGASGGAGPFPVRYGRCSADCGVKSAWTFVTLGDHQALGGLARFVVRPDGAVRVLWTRQSTASDPVAVVVASCDADCTTAASWSSGDVLTLPTASPLLVGDDPLAVDASGKLSLVLGGSTDLTWGACTSACTSAAGWTFSKLTGLAAAAPTLALSLTGQPRVLAGGTAGTGESIVSLFSCDTSCGARSSWTQTTLFWAKPQGRQVLRADAAGQLRAVFFQGLPGRADVAATNDRVLWAWCDTACDQAASWKAVAVGLAVGSGREGLGLSLDAAGLPALAFSTSASPSTLSLARCTAGCTAPSGGTWTTAPVESPADLQAGTPAPLPSCASGSAVWSLGESAALAHNPVKGGLEVAHVASTLQTCGAGSPTRGLELPRFAHLP